MGALVAHSLIEGRRFKVFERLLKYLAPRLAKLKIERAASMTNPDNLAIRAFNTDEVFLNAYPDINFLEDFFGSRVVAFWTVHFGLPETTYRVLRL